MTSVQEITSLPQHFPWLLGPTQNYLSKKGWCVNSKDQLSLRFDASKKCSDGGADDLRLLQAGQMPQTVNDLSIPFGKADRRFPESQPQLMRRKDLGCNPNAELYGEGRADYQRFVSTSKNSGYCAAQSADRAELDWLFAPKVSPLRLCDRVLARLVQLEAHEPNPHFKSDYRQAFICLTLANRGNTEPHNAASYAVHGCADSKVWPRIVAERKAKLGKEYSDFYDAAGNLRPDAPKKSVEGSADRTGCTNNVVATSGENPHLSADVPKKDSAATQTPLTADTGADSPKLPALASAPVLQFPKKETA